MECRDCEYRKCCHRQCMKLPEGKTCGDCKHLAWCTQAYGVKAENTMCDFEPIRFQEREA